ncbi:hypothetical protein QTP88_027157 [Uroleucon formosanum]
MALHRVAEEIRIHFPNVDELINNGKKVFLKAPSRIQIFKTMAPDIPLPPRPVLTRWGTWLNASNANFSKLATSITQLETSGVPLIDSINFIQKIKADILKVPNQFGKIIYQKLTTTLNKNKGFKITSDISDILNGQGATNEIPDDLTVNDLAFFKYSLITSVDVERSFSIYKNLLADNRRSFLFENLKQALVVQCNSSECTVKCGYCSKILSVAAGSFGNLNRHLRTVHPAVILSTPKPTEMVHNEDVVDDPGTPVESDTPNSKVTTKQQSSITNFLQSKKPVSIVRSKQLDDQVTRMIVKG